MSTINYNIPGDFTNGVDIGLFSDELRENKPDIKSKLSYIKKNSSVVCLVFKETLTAQEILDVDGLVANHAAVEPRDHCFHVYPELRKVSNSTYTSVGSFKYDGINRIGNIHYIDIIAKKHNQATSYSVKVVDNSTGLILVEKTGLTNDTYSAIDLGSISNISNSPTIVDVLVKRDGGSKKNIYIQQILVYCDN